MNPDLIKAMQRKPQPEPARHDATDLTPAERRVLRMTLAIVFLFFGAACISLLPIELAHDVLLVTVGALVMWRVCE